MGKNKKVEDGPVQYNIKNSSNFDDDVNNNNYDEQPDAEAQLSEQDHVVTYMNETIQAIRSSVDQLNDQEELIQPFGVSDQALPNEYGSNYASQNNSLPRNDAKGRNSHEMLSAGNANGGKKDKDNRKKSKQDFYGTNSKNNSKVFPGSKQNSKVFGKNSAAQRADADEGDDEAQMEEAGIKFQPKKDGQEEAVDDAASTGKQSRGRVSSHSGEKRTGNSQHSLPSSSVTGGRASNAREVSETFTTKLTNMFWCFFALVVNIVLLYYFVQMGTGLTLPIGIDSVSTVGSVVIEILLILANLAALKALNDGAAAFFGHRLSFKKGYSLAVVGFIQTPGIRKFGYCNELSLNSTCRRFLSRISLIWILLELVIILSPFAATSILGEDVRVDEGYVDCIEFGQKFSPVDRQWPTDETEQGFAELIFGTALGQVRSEFPEYNVTTAVMAPQIVGAVQDGDTMAGSGFTTDIFTTCECTRGNEAADVVDTYNHISTTEAEAIVYEVGNLTDLGLVNYIEYNETDNTVVVNTFMANFDLCGGKGVQFIQSCHTVFSNHTTADVLIEYMTDGTPASIAAKEVWIRNITGEGNMTWVYEALVNILNIRDKVESEVAQPLVGNITLPQTVAGITNPLLWWTTPNLIMVDLSLLEAGLETTFTILLRAGMQRTFSTKGDVCVKNVAVGGASVVTMTPDGIKIVCVIIGFHLLVCLIAIGAYVPWLINEDPILPCIRVLKDNIYFSTLLNSSSINTGFYELCNAPSHAMWQAIDLIARIGETIQTVSEEIGHICMDKPKLVRKLVNGKRYY
jgi:hypothetical protein